MRLTPHIWRKCRPPENVLLRLVALSLPSRTMMSVFSIQKLTWHGVVTMDATHDIWPGGAVVSSYPPITGFTWFSQVSLWCWHIKGTLHWCLVENKFVSSYSIIADSAECQRVVDSHGDPLQLYLCLGGGGGGGDQRAKTNNLGNLCRFKLSRI